MKPAPPAADAGSLTWDVTPVILVGGAPRPVVICSVIRRVAGLIDIDMLSQLGAAWFGRYNGVLRYYVLVGSEMHLQASVEGGVRYIEVAPPLLPRVNFLLVHGLGGSLEQWHEVIEPLGTFARTVAIDVPGFGPGRRQLGKFSIEYAISKIVSFCRELELTNCILVSHSVGCVVAAGLAAAEPSRFRRLIIVSGTLARAAEIAQNPLRALSDPRLGLYVFAQFLAGLFPIPTFALRAVAGSALLRRLTLWPFVAHPREISGEALVNTLSGTGSMAVVRVLFTARNINYTEILSAVPHGVDLIWGFGDPLISESDIARAMELMRVESKEGIRECGHWPWLEKPEELVRFITSRSLDASPDH